MRADRVNKKSEAYRIIKLVITRGAQEHARKYLADQPTAREQLTIACMLQEAATQEYGPHRVSSLSDEIIAGLYRKVVDFGERAHRLSEKQIEAIVRDTVLPHRGSKLNKEINGERHVDHS